MKNVLVLGGSSLVGHGVIKFFLEKGFKVITTSFNKKIFFKNNNIKIINNFNINSEKSLSVFNKYTKKNLIAVINCIAKIPISKKNKKFDKLAYLNTNYLSVLKLLKISEKNKVPNFINISGSSTSILDENLEDEYNFYLLSKKSMDLYIDNETEVKKKIILNTLKISAPYGYVFNRPTIFVNFIKKAIKNKDLKIFGNGNRKQVFTFSEDVGKCCLKLKKKKKSGSYYCMGNFSIKSKYLAKKIVKLFNSKSKIKILNKFNETDTSNVKLLKKINNLNKNSINFDKSIKKIFFYIRDNNILN